MLVAAKLTPTKAHMRPPARASTRTRVCEKAIGFKYVAFGFLGMTLACFDIGALGKIRDDTYTLEVFERLSN